MSHTSLPSKSLACKNSEELNQVKLPEPEGNKRRSSQNQTMKPITRRVNPKQQEEMTESIRLKNRLAASKCRQRKGQHIMYLETQFKGTIRQEEGQNDI